MLMIATEQAKQDLAKRLKKGRERQAELFSLWLSAPAEQKAKAKRAFLKADEKLNAMSLRYNQLIGF